MSNVGDHQYCKGRVCGKRCGQSGRCSEDYKKFGESSKLKFNSSSLYNELILQPLAVFKNWNPLLAAGLSFRPGLHCPCFQSQENTDLSMG